MPFARVWPKHGLVEGQNVIIEFSWADGNYERLPAQANHLLTRQPAVLISAGGDMSAKAASAATKTTPIVAIFIAIRSSEILSKASAGWWQYYGQSAI
jgi:ABC-type uncharacterized transport system substrate-binding protein